MLKEILKEREKSILRYVIHQYILTATPVGSRNIAKKYEIGLSPATIRNIMADLEDLGFLNHPHTSAGRIPTDLGYRFYVDSLMPRISLDQNEKDFIDANLKTAVSDKDIIKTTAELLSTITHQIACVTYPQFEEAKLKKIQIVQLSTSRILIVIEIFSGLVRTITLEISTKIEKKELQVVEKLLNQRLSELTFKQIKESFPERFRDKMNTSLQPIIRLFLDSSDKIFSDNNDDEKAYIYGAKEALSHPEFLETGKFGSIIELIENKDVIIHLIQESSNDTLFSTNISIGLEQKDKNLEDYSLISKKYKVGEINGSLGIIGPTRMEYSKTVAVIEYLAEQISKEMKRLSL